jgi:acylphosphatase
MSEPRAIRCLVSGRVQRVRYRAATVDRATALELDGSVRNLPDGRVEVVVAGEPDAVETLVAWLWKGPPAAAVSAVVLEDWPANPCLALEGAASGCRLGGRARGLAGEPPPRFQAGALSSGTRRTFSAGTTWWSGD